MKTFLGAPPLEILISDEAERQLEDLDKGIRRQVETKINTLANWPNVAGAQPMWGRGHGFHRVKVRDWRIVFHVDEREGIVFVDFIGQREWVYRRFHD